MNDANEKLPAMATPRRQLIDSQTPLYYHLVSRCVRRGWLCGFDPLTGCHYDHSQHWVCVRKFSQVFASFSLVFRMAYLFFISVVEEFSFRLILPTLLSGPVGMIPAVLFSNFLFACIHYITLRWKFINCAVFLQPV